MSKKDVLGDPRDRRWFERPTFIRRVNGWFTLFWATWSVPAIAIKGFRVSVFLVALYSIWANIVSHYTAWIAARVEEREEKMEIAEIEAEES